MFAATGQRRRVAADPDAGPVGTSWLRSAAAPADRPRPPARIRGSRVARQRELSLVVVMLVLGALRRDPGAAVPVDVAT